MSLPEQIQQSVRAAFRASPFFPTARKLREALAAQLSPSVREATMHFGPAALPGDDDDELADPVEQRGARQLDILWHSPDGPVAIEIRLRHLAHWFGKLRGSPIKTPPFSEVHGRGFLLDIHRLERLIGVSKGQTSWEPVRRFALFVTNDPLYFRDGDPQRSFSIVHGSQLPAGHTAAFDVPSVKSRWRNYPPFRLASSYDLHWVDVGNDVSDFERSIADGRQWLSSRMLLLEVQPVSSAAGPGAAQSGTAQSGTAQSGDGS
jgi:hypothetical protein